MTAVTWPMISVVIPCLNAEKMIGTQLEALARQQYSGSWEVVVADNGSTDGTLKVVEQYRTRLPHLIVVDASDRKGAAHARNVGARMAQGEAILFTDADDEVATGWMEAMGRALTQHDFVACRLDTKKLNPLWVQQVRVMVQEHALTTLPYHPRFPIASGNSLGVKRSLHEAVGGFDESLLSVEDPDYCVRIQQRGSSIQLVPAAVVHYRYRPTLATIYQQARTYAKWNMCLFKRYSEDQDRALWRWRIYLKECGRILKQVPGIRDKAGLGRWLWKVGWHVGLLQGAIRYRISPFFL